MKLIKTLLVLCALLALIFGAKPLFAAQSNFMISPPPIPWFEFQQEQVDMRVGGTFFQLTGDIDPEPPATKKEKIKITGGGLSGIGRFAFTDVLAIDGGMSVFGGGGSVGSDTDVSMGAFSIPLDLEIQAVRTDNFCLILFGGLNYAFSYVNVYSVTATGDFEIDLWTNQWGPQVGIQASLKTGAFAITPFFLLQRLSGSASFDFYSNGVLQYSDTVDIPGTTFTFYGLDIAYIPANITLSTIIQQVMASGDNNGFRSIIISLSYDFQFGGPENKE